MSTNKRMFHRARFAPRAAALTGSVLAILAAAADAQAVTEWDLPEQPLAKSLREIAAQTESNILFDKKLVNAQSAPPLKMKATTEQALKQLLEGTGLTYRHLDDKTVTIQLASAEPSATTSGSYGPSDGRIRLAQADTGETAAPRERTVEGRPLTDIEEIIVTGTNIRGIENNTAQVTVLSREYINATGYSTVTKLLESVTQNFALANQSGLNIPGVGGSREQGAAINLRGIGEGTTLVLINGRRLAPGFRSAAVDISALPLSAVERVEILPDGASALYGSDAVGGVVNFILRDDFEGAETRLRAGTADGIDEYRGSQAVGGSWDSGNALISAEYYKRDLLLASDRDFVPSTSIVGSLSPEEKNYSALFTGRQNLAGSLSVFADAFYSKRESYNFGGRLTLGESTTSDNPQMAATLGVDWSFGGDWQLEVSGSYADNELEQTQNNRTATGVANNNMFDSEFEIQAGEAKIDGTLFNLPGGPVRAALGVGYRSESYSDLSKRVVGGAVNFSVDSDQNIKSAFGELYVPIFGDTNAVEGVRRLELSLAGRYDDYSTAGSSVDPQVGLMYEPVAGFRLRGRYGTSYKAPNLADYNLASNSAIAAFANIPGLGQRYLLQVTGTDVSGLEPQESESSSFGFDYVPESANGLTLSLNYYRIRYSGLIATPATAAVILSNPAVYGDLIFNDPSNDLVNQFVAIGRQGLTGFRAFLTPPTLNPNFTPDQVDIIVDGRRRNLSVVKTSGLDLSTQYDAKLAGGTLTVGVGGTYILERDTQVTRSAGETDTVDTIFNPPNWRARAMVGWQRAGFSTNLFVNHTDSYTDNRLVTGLPPNREVDAYTTMDVRVAYDFSKRFKEGFLSGFVVALSAQNALDEDPPSTAISGVSTFDVGYDPANASPIGRLIAIEFTKAW
ncbi:TonB-dependent receptor [Peristeroidobacter soli]|uniref:TonB-dependent receptor n=1 Tax=Peristeroidobacter soli TaxID=2497877 RepID=UPI00101BE3A1|nr:TonB-dependent receptor [Peristeroidobacter soli]